MARSFNGTSDKLVFPSAVTVPTLNTFVSWAYSATGSVCLFIGGSSGGTNGYVEFRKDSATDKLQIIREQVTLIATSTGTVAGNTWTHCACTLDITTLASPLYAFYIGGTLSGSGTGSGISAFSNNIPSLGNSFAEGFTPGRNSDWAWWNVLLTAGEIAALAAGVRPFTIRPNNLLAYLPLDGLSSPEPDLSGNGRNGTLTGTTAVSGPPTTYFTPRWPSNLPPPAASFIPAWFQGTNLPVIGTGLY